MSPQLPSISLGSLPTPPMSSSRDTELDACKVQLSLFAGRLDDLKAYMGQESVKMDGVKLKSLLHTTSWMKKELSSSSYHIYHDPVTLLDAVGASQMSNKEFLNESYHATRGNFRNEVAAHTAASFGRELPPLLGKVEPTASGGQPASTHPLPLIKLYESFNPADQRSGVKHRINDEMNNTINSISTDIVSLFSVNPSTLMLANTFLVTSRSIIDSLLSWME